MILTAVVSWESWEGNPDIQDMPTVGWPDAVKGFMNYLARQVLFLTLPRNPKTAPPVHGTHRVASSLYV